MRAWVFIPLVVCATVVVAGFGVLLAVAKPATPASPDYRVVPLGGLQYEAMLARPIQPSDSVDASIVSGLRARDRRLRKGQMLFGAFIAVTNDSLRFVPAAERIDLRDQSGHVYRPLHLPTTNPYAYAPRAIPPKTRVPISGTRADDNLASTGELVLFRIPAGSYESGVLELVIHDHVGGVASLVV